MKKIILLLLLLSSIVFSSTQEEYDNCECNGNWYVSSERNSTHQTLVRIGAEPPSYPSQFHCNTNYSRSITTYTPCVITGYVGGYLGGLPSHICTYSYKFIYDRCKICTEEDTNYTPPENCKQNLTSII